MNALKVAVLVPSYGPWNGKFGQSLCNMLNYFLSTTLQAPDGAEYKKRVETFCVSGSMLPEVRHRLIAEAIHWGADFALCLDSDQVFPPDTLDRLLVHNVAIVGCNYVRRSIPTAPTAAYDGDKTGKAGWDNIVYTTQELADAEVLEEVGHLGMGVVLLNMKIFDHLQATAEKNGERTFLPLFEFEPTENKIGLTGEDVYFFRKCRKAGIPVHLDHALSWRVGHVAELVMTNAHAVAQKDEWAKASQALKDRYLEKAEALEGAA